MILKPLIHICVFTLQGRFDVILPMFVVILHFRHLSILLPWKLVKPAEHSTASSTRTQKEYRAMSILVTSSQLAESLSSYPSCPSELLHWAKNPMASWEFTHLVRASSYTGLRIQWLRESLPSCPSELLHWAKNPMASWEFTHLVQASSYTGLRIQWLRESLPSCPSELLHWAKNPMASWQFLRNEYLNLLNNSIYLVSILLKSKPGGWCIW